MLIFTQSLLDVLPSYVLFIPILILATYVLNRLLVRIRQKSTSDLRCIPQPYLSVWRRLTIGHNTPHYIFGTESLAAASQFNKWRHECGPIYQLRYLWFGHSVVFTSKEAIRSVFITKQSSFVKTAQMRAFLAPFTGNNGILLAEGERHSRLRRAVAPSMHHDALIAVGDIFIKEGRLLAEQLAEMADEGADIRQKVRDATFAVIFQACFGQDALSEHEFAMLRDAYRKIFSEPPWHLLLFALLRKLLWFIDAELFSWRRDMKKYIRRTVFEFCERRVQHIKSSRGETTHLLWLMVDSETNKALTSEELLETVQSFLAAGQITTSYAVTWTLYLLGREPQWQQKLFQELQKWSEEDGLSALDHLPLLGRIVRESIRLYPPIFYVTRETAKPVEIDGYKLPAGTTIRLPVLAVHRCEDIWGSDVHEFNPDRFLREGEFERTKLHWCVFVFGQRGCIGQRFALLEIKAFIAQVVKRTEVYIKPLEDPAPTCIGPFSNPRNMRVYFRAR